MHAAPSPANPSVPERILSASGSVCMVEVSQKLGDGTTWVAGYRVYAEDGKSSALHATLDEAETDFLRRTWR
jgi:hypothetical protein